MSRDHYMQGRPLCVNCGEVMKKAGRVPSGKQAWVCGHKRKVICSRAYTEIDDSIAPIRRTDIPRAEIEALWGTDTMRGIARQLDATVWTVKKLATQYGLLIPQRRQERPITVTLAEGETDPTMMREWARTPLSTRKGINGYWLTARRTGERPYFC